VKQDSLSSFIRFKKLWLWTCSFTCWFWIKIKLWSP